MVREKRQKIVKAVVKLFIKKEFDRTSTREISRETGITIGNLYNYIKNKEDLLYLVHDYMMSGVYTTLFSTEQMKWGGLDKFRSSLKSFFAHSLEFKDEILLMYRQTGLLKKSARKSLLARENRKIQQMKKLLDQGVREGSFHIKNTEVTANIIVYLVAMLALRGWNLEQYKDEELIDILSDFIIKRLL